MENNQAVIAEGSISTEAALIELMKDNPLDPVVAYAVSKMIEEGSAVFSGKEKQQIVELSREGLVGMGIKGREIGMEYFQTIILQLEK